MSVCGVRFIFALLQLFQCGLAAVGSSSPVEVEYEDPFRRDFHLLRHALFSPLRTHARDTKGTDDSNTEEEQEEEEEEAEADVFHRPTQRSRFQTLAATGNRRPMGKRLWGSAVERRTHGNRPYWPLLDGVRGNAYHGNMIDLIGSGIIG